MTGVLDANPIGKGPIGSTMIGGAALTGSQSTLTAAAGSFTLSGQASTFQSIRKISCLAGSFTLTGNDATLPNPKAAAAGAFTLTGQNVALLQTHRLPCAAESFTLAGQAATLKNAGRSLVASAGSFTLTGQSASPQRAYFLDPYRSYVTYHHHCDSRTEGISKTDVIPINSPTISTTVSKFGTGSFNLTGANDYFYTPASTYSPIGSAFAFETGPFTIEGWFRFEATPTDSMLLSQWGGGFRFGFSGGHFSFWSADGTQAGTAFSPTLSQWYNLTVDRDASGTLRLYVDGAMVSKTTSYSHTTGGSSAALIIGAWQGYSYDFNGYADELRITKGVCRYGSDAGFTPRTEAFSFARLSASAGSFTETGSDATFSRSAPLLIARTGAVTLQGGEARFNGLDGAAYTLTGRDVTLRYIIPTRLYAAAGAFDLTRNPASLDKRKAIIGARGTFTAAARDARLVYSRVFPADAGAYTFAGQDARPFRRPRVFAATGAFSAVFKIADLLRNRTLSAAAGSVALSGFDAGLKPIKRLSSGVGAFALFGVDASSLYNHRLSCNAAAFSALTVPARTLKTNRLEANSGQFDAINQGTRLNRGFRLRSAAGSFGWSGYAAKKNIVRAGKPGRFYVTGGKAELWAGWGGDAVGIVSSPVATAQVAAQGTARGNVTAPQAQATWSDR